MTLTQSSKQRFHLAHLSQYDYCDDLQLKEKKLPTTNIKSKAYLEQTLQKSMGENNRRLQLLLTSTMLKENL